MPKSRLGVSSSSSMSFFSSLSFTLDLLWLAAAVCLWSTVTTALAPPHPTWKDYETVFAMRKRLNITYNYTPIHLTHEHCRYLNESMCQQEDERHGEARRKRRELREKQRRLVNPDQGKFQILVLLGYFPEDANLVSKNIVPSTTYIDTLYNGAGVSATNPVGSLKEYIQYNSVGLYHANFVVQDWKKLANSQAYYSQNQSGRLSAMQMAQVFIPLLQAMDSAGFNWAPYDANGDGLLDALEFIHSGYPAELGEMTCAAPAAQRLWSQGVSSCPGCWTSKDGKYALGGYGISGGFTLGWNNCSKPTDMAIPQHGTLERSAEPIIAR